nr:MAG TPA: hypothetical protein [Caudoviricetes sp.]
MAKLIKHRSIGKIRMELAVCCFANKAIIRKAGKHGKVN